MINTTALKQNCTNAILKSCNFALASAVLYVAAKLFIINVLAFHTYTRLI